MSAFPASAQDSPGDDAEKNRPLKREEMAVEGKRAKRDAFYQARRQHKDPSALHDPASARLSAIRALRADQKARGFQKAGADAIQWTEIGPAPTTDGQTPTSSPRIPSDVSGRITTIAIAPTSGTVYVGGA
ncbi:MAG: hypothetical protein MI919_41350, partial [Holophagales bacterium]|nr:hypothetical protein [Holophagales bacterium]